jgi:hypothetical protein
MVKALAVQDEAVLPIAPWRRQRGEPAKAHLHFLAWCFCECELVESWAERWQWAERRQAIETLEGVALLSLSDMGAESAVARVQIAFAEIKKLQHRVFSSPDQILANGEVFQQAQWIQEAALGVMDRRAAKLDWSSLTPEDREIMIKAKRIQDKLLAKTNA